MFLTAVGLSVFTLRGHFEFSLKKEASIWALNYARAILPSIYFRPRCKFSKDNRFHLAFDVTAFRVPVLLGTGRLCSCRSVSVSEL